MSEDHEREEFREEHYVLDQYALLAAGAGNALASVLIHRANFHAEWRLYVPACALVEADRERKGIAEQFAALPGVTFMELDLSSALAVSAAAPSASWAHAQVVHAASPSPGWPKGAVIVTTEPAAYPALPTLDLT